MVWNLEEAFNQQGGALPKLDEITKKSITEADRHMLAVVKDTEGLPDEERIKHLHNAIGYILPYLTKVPSAPTDPIKRVVKLIKTLKKGYLEYSEETCENPSKKMLNAIKKLDFSKLDAMDWFDILETISFHVEESDYNSDIQKMHTIAEFFFYLDGSKRHAMEKI